MRSPKYASVCLMIFLGGLLQIGLAACRSSSELAEIQYSQAPVTVKLPERNLAADEVESPENGRAEIAFPLEEAEGCRIPGNTYSLVQVNGQILNQRTLEMLEYAYSLYGGAIDIRGPAITQGSYTIETPESYFTHAGGGAVDISVYDKSGERWVLLEDEIDPLIQALRIAGFAAWYRPADYERHGSPAHIHAIAIGDQFLSPEAKGQLNGSCGYFKGKAGLPIMDYECRQVSEPRADIHGGPIVCDWMCALPYSSISGLMQCKHLSQGSH